MVEVVSEDRGIRCDIRERICPAFVFGRDASGLPILARQDDCRTDALFMAERADGPTGITVAEVEDRDL